MKNASKKQYQMDIDEFTMMDDLFLSTMLDGHPDVVEEMLLPIIGKDMKITEAVTQRVENNLFGRAVRLDVLAVHVNKKKLIDTAVNIEVENWGQDANPSRARYNHAMMDTTVTAKGLAWDELPETYVILIYRHDYFKKGYALYHIENIVRETGEIFDDKAHIIYVNGDYKNNRTKIGKLIHDLRCQNPDDMYNQKIAERARNTKSERKERIHMKIFVPIPKNRHISGLLFHSQSFMLFSSFSGFILQLENGGVPKMSLRITINELPWNVYYVPHDHVKLDGDDGDPAMGITYFGELNTYIRNTNICDALIERVCRHEATHMTLFSYGFNGDDMNEEDICNFFECHGEEICNVARKMAVHYEKEKWN